MNATKLVSIGVKIATDKVGDIESFKQLLQEANVASRAELSRLHTVAEIKDFLLTTVFNKKKNQIIHFFDHASDDVKKHIYNTWKSYLGVKAFRYIKKLFSPKEQEKVVLLFSYGIGMKYVTDKKSNKTHTMVDSLMDSLLLDNLFNESEEPLLFEDDNSSNDKNNENNKNSEDNKDNKDNKENKKEGFLKNISWGVLVAIGLALVGVYLVSVDQVGLGVAVLVGAGLLAWFTFGSDGNKEKVEKKSNEIEKAAKEEGQAAQENKEEIKEELNKPESSNKQTQPQPQQTQPQQTQQAQPKQPKNEEKPQPAIKNMSEQLYDEINNALKSNIMASVGNHDIGDENVFDEAVNNRIAEASKKKESTNQEPETNTNVKNTKSGNEPTEQGNPKPPAGENLLKLV